MAARKVKINSHPKMIKPTETKRRKRRLILYESLSAALIAVACFLYFINHTLAVVSIPMLLGGLIFAASSLRLSLINNGSIHSIANWWWIIIAIPSVILCGYLPEIPGVSFFSFGGALVDNGGLLKALKIISTNSCKNGLVASMPYDPHFTNAELVVFIRKK
ncbi:MAG: hypothetical protein WDM76_03090 [Limisphaerales bacterium]